MTAGRSGRSVLLVAAAPGAAFALAALAGWLTGDRSQGKRPAARGPAAAVVTARELPARPPARLAALATVGTIPALRAEPVQQTSQAGASGGTPSQTGSASSSTGASSTSSPAGSSTPSPTGSSSGSSAPAKTAPAGSQAPAKTTPAGGDACLINCH